MGVGGAHRPAVRAAAPAVRAGRPLFRGRGVRGRPPAPAPPHLPGPETVGRPAGGRAGHHFAHHPWGRHPGGLLPLAGAGAADGLHAVEDGVDRVGEGDGARCAEADPAADGVLGVVEEDAGLGTCPTVPPLGAPAGAPKPVVFVTLVVSPLFSDEDCVGSSNLIVTSLPETFVTVPVTRGPPPPKPPGMPPPWLVAVPEFRALAEPPPAPPANPVANPVRFSESPGALVAVALWWPYQAPADNKATTTNAPAKRRVYLLVHSYLPLASSSFK